MRAALRFIMALAVTILIMVVFRSLAFTVYTVSGNALEPFLLSGDRVLVNRWSYGLRTGGGSMFSYTRWIDQPVSRGDLVAFNCPADSQRRIADRTVFICWCKGVPGDTVNTPAGLMTVPGRDFNVRVTPQNIQLIAYLYNHFEGRKATVSDGKLTIDGKMLRCANFTYNYYWLCANGANKKTGDSYEGLVPETHIIGRAAMLLYSIQPERPITDRFRTDRCLLFINNGAE